jgi:hypothetical protein
MKHIGGKLLVFGACIPSVGELALKSTRDNPRRSSGALKNHVEILW